MPTKAVQPNVYSYNAAISACARAGEWQEALKLLSLMGEAGVQPNTITCDRRQNRPTAVEHPPWNTRREHRREHRQAECGALFVAS